MNAAISVSNLRKTYPRSWASPPFEALKGISLSIEPGETFGFNGLVLRVPDVAPGPEARAASEVVVPLRRAL